MSTNVVRKFVAVTLALALGVGLVSVVGTPAHASAPPIGYGGVAYAPWTEDIQTYKTQGNGLCLSYDDVRLRLQDASMQASKSYPSADVAKPDPRAVAAYRAASAKVLQDVAGMSSECRLTLFWQVYTVVKHLQLQDRQIFVSKDGRHTLISASPLPLDGWEPAQAEGGTCGGCASVEAMAREAQARAQEGCACPNGAWGAAMQALGGIYTVGGIAFAGLSQVFTDRQQMLASLASMFGSIGVTMMALPGIIDFFSSIWEGTGSRGGRNDAGDPCCCGCSH